MKVFTVFCFAFGLAHTSCWILCEKSSPRTPTSFLLHQTAPVRAALNMPAGRRAGSGRFGRLVQLNEAPDLCRLRGVCNQIYYKNRSEYKRIFEVMPPFRNAKDNVYPIRRMKGRQAFQSRRGYLPRNSVIYMSPDSIILRPVAASSQVWPPLRKSAHPGFREVPLKKAMKVRAPKPESQITENQEFTEKSNVSKEVTSAPVEIRRTFAEVSSREGNRNSSFEKSYSEPRPSSVRPYAVKEIVDENQHIEGELKFGTERKSLFVPYLNEETSTEAYRKTSVDSRIVKIIPLAERNETSPKHSQNTTANRHPLTNDNFFRIVPIRGPNKKPNERPVNRQQQIKNLKILPTWRQIPAEATANNLSTFGIYPSATPRVENKTEMTSSRTTIIRQKTTVNITSDDRKGVPHRENHKGFPSPVTEREFKTQQTFPSKSEKPTVAPSKIKSTPSEVTFMVREIVNVTNAPEHYTVTWRLQDDGTATSREILNTIGYITSTNLTEEFTDRPFTFDLMPARADAKKDQESFSKNSRKMHFGQESQPNEIDQRRSDILITDNFDDYFDEEYNLNYLEKLKRKNNSVESLKNLTSEYLIPLIPLIIQDIRQGKIPPEDISLLSEAFGKRWTTVLELSNSTNIDMLPLLKMKDESDLRNVLQSILPSSEEPTTTQRAVSVGADMDYESYDYLQKLKDLYEDLLTVEQELEGDEEKTFEKRHKGWKRSGVASKT